MAVPFKKAWGDVKGILNFMLRHILLNLLEEKVQKRYHVVHDWSWNILSDKLEGGSVADHISQLCFWGFRFVSCKDGKHDMIVVPYNDCKHWSLFVFEYNHTYHFDPIPSYHSKNAAAIFL